MARHRFGLSRHRAVVFHSGRRASTGALRVLGFRVLFRTVGKVWDLRAAKVGRFLTCNTNTEARE